MSLLLDTNIILWAAEGNARLSGEVIDLLRDPTEIVFVSAVSSVEIAIKWSQGKIDLPQEPGEFLSNAVANAGYSQLAITIEHAVGLVKLPYHHRDPWDRLLIAQARATRFRVITSDKIFKEYDVDAIIT
jgi:PIN domain nuclease of toxin-antitoxin system